MSGCLNCKFMNAHDRNSNSGPVCIRSDYCKFEPKKKPKEKTK